MSSSSKTYSECRTLTKDAARQLHEVGWSVKKIRDAAENIASGCVPQTDQGLADMFQSAKELGHRKIQKGENNVFQVLQRAIRESLAAEVIAVCMHLEGAASRQEGELDPSA